jgi:hypothetical protein
VEKIVITEAKNQARIRFIFISKNIKTNLKRARPIIVTTTKIVFQSSIKLAGSILKNIAIISRENQTIAMLSNKIKAFMSGVFLDLVSKKNIKTAIIKIVAMCMIVKMLKIIF